MIRRVVKKNVMSKKVSRIGSTTLDNYKALKKKYNTAFLKPYIENSCGQEVDEKDFVGDEQPDKKSLDNVSIEKPSNAKPLRKSNCKSNYWNILPGELVKKFCFVQLKDQVTFCLIIKVKPITVYSKSVIGSK